jgi:hypothetical protein
MKPYAADRVISENFVGRESVLDELMNHTMTGRSVIVAAGRRTGKTMLLRELASRLTSNGALSVYIDTQALAGPDCAAEFVSLVVAASVASVDGEVPAPGGMVDAVERVVAAGRRWCLIVDEIEGLAQAPSGSTVLDNLRHLVSNSRVAGDATVIIAGGLDLNVRLRSTGSSLTNVCRPVHLPPFSRGELGDLVTLGVPEPDRGRVLDYLWTLAGGHPYVAQYLLESMPLPVPDQLDRDGGKAISDCVARLRTYVRSLDQLPRNAARQLVRGAIPGAHIGDALVEAGLARREEGGLVTNGEIVGRAVLADAAASEGDTRGVADATWLTGLLGAGETPFVEFKESVKWDVRRKIEDDTLKYEVPQAIAAFTNSDGGSLLLGVADDGSIAGLAPDMALIRRNPTLDGVMLLVSNLLRDVIGGVAAREVRFASATVEAGAVLVLTVEPATRPVFAEIAKRPHFFVRIGPSTVDLDVREAVDYIQRRWPRNELA